jgi:hypothetical protein
MSPVTSRSLVPSIVISILSLKTVSALVPPVSDLSSRQMNTA